MKKGASHEKTAYCGRQQHNKPSVLRHKTAYHLGWTSHQCDIWYDKYIDKAYIGAISRLLCGCV